LKRRRVVALIRDFVLSLGLTVGCAKVKTKPKALRKVRFKGTVKQVVQLETGIKVAVGDTLAGLFTYDASLITDPNPGELLDIIPLSSFEFTVGAFSGSLNPSTGGYFAPVPLNSAINNIGVFFQTADRSELPGGNTFNAGGGTFVIGNAGNGGILGSYTTKSIE